MRICTDLCLPPTWTHEYIHLQTASCSTVLAQLQLQGDQVCYTIIYPTYLTRQMNTSDSGLVRQKLWCGPSCLHSLSTIVQKQYRIMYGQLYIIAYRCCYIWHNLYAHKCAHVPQFLLEVGTGAYEGVYTIYS